MSPVRSFDAMVRSFNEIRRRTAPRQVQMESRTGNKPMTLTTLDGAFTAPTVLGHETHRKRRDIDEAASILRVACACLGIVYRCTESQKYRLVVLVSSCGMTFMLFNSYNWPKSSCAVVRKVMRWQNIRVVSQSNFRESDLHQRVFLSNLPSKRGVQHLRLD